MKTNEIVRMRVRGWRARRIPLFGRGLVIFWFFLNFFFLSVLYIRYVYLYVLIKTRSMSGGMIALRIKE